MDRMEIKTFEEAIDFVREKSKQVLISKQKDYGPGNILAFREVGVLVRVYDKVERLRNLLMNNREPSNESLDDTWLDIENYATIARMLRAGIFELPLAEEGKKQDFAVYLAGPISDVDIHEAAAWRREAETKLEAAEIRAYNPLRGKDLSDPGVKTNLDYVEVVERDLHDIYCSDIVLVDLRREVKMVGTAMEIAHAKLWGKHVFAFGQAYRENYWIRYHVNRFFGTLDEALKAIVREREKDQAKASA